MKSLLLTFAILFIACTDVKIESVDNLWSSAVKFREKNDLRSSITVFKNIITNYPDSEFSTKSQFQIADIYLNDVKDYSFAIGEYETLISNYPNHLLAKKSRFMIAYIYSNYLEEYSRAIDKYRHFLKEHPNDELVPSVEFELDALIKHENTIDSLNNS